jgi:hypothetical protein
MTHRRYIGRCAYGQGPESARRRSREPRCLSYRRSGEALDILTTLPFELDREGEEQGVEWGTVETFTQEAGGSCQSQSALVSGWACQSDFGSGLLPHLAVQHERHLAPSPVEGDVAVHQRLRASGGRSHRTDRAALDERSVDAVLGEIHGTASERVPELLTHRVPGTVDRPQRPLFSLKSGAVLERRPVGSNYLGPRFAPGF